MLAPQGAAQVSDKNLTLSSSWFPIGKKLAQRNVLILPNDQHKRILSSKYAGATDSGLGNKKDGDGSTVTLEPLAAPLRTNSFFDPGPDEIVYELFEVYELQVSCELFDMDTEKQYRYTYEEDLKRVEQESLSKEVYGSSNRRGSTMERMATGNRSSLSLFDGAPKAIPSSDGAAAAAAQREIVGRDALRSFLHLNLNRSWNALCKKVE